MSTDENVETTPVTADSVRQLHDALARSARVMLLIYHRRGVETLPIPEGKTVVVGRAPPADLVIEESSLSRRHAGFTHRNGKVTVEDLGSKNGTHVDDEPVQQAVIKPGNTVTMGSVIATVHILAPTDRELVGVGDHDEFRSALQAEIVRVRHFDRGAGLIMVKALDPSSLRLTHWCARVQKLVRRVDRVAVYSSEVLEILVVEATAESVSHLARALTEATDVPLCCGAALYPTVAGSADQLIEAARDALRRATATQRAQIAPVQDHRFTVPFGDDARPNLVIESPAMTTVFDQVKRLASAAIPVLIQGETGVGKEDVARSLHELGNRRDAPMCCVNCGAISGQLVESTLFGHERGAFTGAGQRRKGVFESAEGGTVLLDEIGELPPPAQVALLRVLETKRITRVGSSQEVDVNVRVIAATHRDLQAMCADGSFRQDLFYRLNAVTLEIPPLRTRPEEIPALVERFLEQANHDNGRAVRGVDPQALELLRRYSWPGNIRELRNAIQRAVVLASDEVIGVVDLPQAVRAAEALRGSDPIGETTAIAGPPSQVVSTPTATVDGGEGEAEEELALKERLQRYEARLILEALQASDWNQTEAARQLKMPLRTLVHKLNKYGIKKEYVGERDD